MGLLDNTTHADYYESNNLGNYQFTSLDDIITQFEIAYVGEDKIISKIKRVDIAYHAQRGLQEFSFDTLKSFKAYQIDVPASLQMKLPHDYVNYTKLSWVDSAGIKHRLLPTSDTSNPYQIWQADTGEYNFPEDLNLVVNGDFSAATLAGDIPASPWILNYAPSTPIVDPITNITTYTVYAGYQVINGKLNFKHRTRATGYGASSSWGYVISTWQELDVSGQGYVDISAVATALDVANGPGVLRLGITTNQPDTNTKMLENSYSNMSLNSFPSIFNLFTSTGEPSYLEWRSVDGANAEKELLQIDVRNHTKVYVLVTSFHEVVGINETLQETNSIDNITVANSSAGGYLSEDPSHHKASSTWNSYKSHTSSNNNNDDYEDDTYWPANGERYGLDPQHSNVNGSFFIDQRIGKIHFSSNISGKTVILDYISDSIGTDEEMQVHKFAEEAMYKYIAHAILSTRANTPEYLVQRFKKERFAAVRTAKLRLSNIKLEELTQILRGKSKQIKH